MHRALGLCTLVLGTGVLVSCTRSSGSSDSSATAAFQLEKISLLNNAVWEINRPIDFEFTAPVDFSSVSSNTINIETLSGLPATGSFSFKRRDTNADGIPDTTDETTIVFQPNCPLESDFSDAGLTPGDVQYVITVVGRSSGTTNTIRSKGGRPLQVTQTRRFSTPDSLDAEDIFLDSVFGPPSPVVRSAGSTVTQGVSFVELGGNPDPSTRIYFEFDATTQTFGVAPGANAPSELPLNLYSELASQSAFLIEFNQAVDPSPVNIAESRIRLEYQDAGGSWIPLETQLELVANCAGAGATLRLEPVGVLPSASQVRAVVLPGFRDLSASETTLTPRNLFAVAPTRTLNYTSLSNPTDGADEIAEDFDFNSFEDVGALFDAPKARWANGKLEAAFEFDGTGGPGGDFDWYVRSGEEFTFDTVSTLIEGGPGGAKTTVQASTNGIVDVRDLVVEAGGVLRVSGNRSMQINATGTVRIDGLLDLSGFDAPDVTSSNTGDQPSAGGAGAAGGGRGGSASDNIKTSTARGGTGGGPFGQAAAGGQGGESGFADKGLGKDARRPGGGGGGRFGQDFVPNGLAGLGATAGVSGAATSRGALTGVSPALGGAPRGGAFLDADPQNDVFGVKPVATYNAGTGIGTLQDLVRGELTQLWAGYGGGGGGDALPSMQFPTPGWTPASDEKGGGGGGGGGGLHIRALGPIVFGHGGGALGRILAEGGQGGLGENVLLIDHVGGTGGSGSGGHVVLESASMVDFADGEPGFAAPSPFVEFVSVRGGAQRIGPTMSGEEVIPPDVSYGGSGGPGLIQIHVPRLNAPGTNPANTDIVVPSYADAAVAGGSLPTKVAAELDKVTKPYARIMIPTFGARSKTRSKWIALGGADVNPMGGNDLVQFLFGGTDTAVGPDQGKILTTAGVVDELPALLGPETFPSATVAVLPDGVTLSITGTSLDPLVMSMAPVSEDLYLRTPSLLKHFTLRVRESGMPLTTADFEVVSAAYDDTTLTLTVQNSTQTLAAFAATLTTAEYELLPRFFRVETNDVVDSLPDTAFVKITFEGAADDGLGNPDENMLLVPETGDISELSTIPMPGELKFFRFIVEFDLDALAMNVGPDTKPVSLRFLKIPFRF